MNVQWQVYIVTINTHTKLCEIYIYIFEAWRDLSGFKPCNVACMHGNKACTQLVVTSLVHNLHHYHALHAWYVALSCTAVCYSVYDFTVGNA